VDRAALYRLYWKMQPAIAPGLEDSQYTYECMLARTVAGTSRWLDLGCGHHLLPPWRTEQEIRLICGANLVVGIDYDHLSLTKHQTIGNLVRGNISRLPFADGTFDLVTSNMVFEHLEHPEQQLREIWRVLAPGGQLIFHTPNKFGYATWMARMVPEAVKDKFVLFFQGRAEEDVFPAFYRINTPQSIHRLATQAGFAKIEIKHTCAFAQFVVIPPLALLELFWIRFLMSKSGRRLRPYLITTLEKAAAPAAPAPA
jgi:ubiquinone/menaquinone biosynthesis C-methylase UbiE